MLLVLQKEHRPHVNLTVGSATFDQISETTVTGGRKSSRVIPQEQVVPDLKEKEQYKS